MSKENNIIHTSQIKFMKGEHKKFTDLIVMMLSGNVLPFYAEFNTFINFYESTNSSLTTCGVNMSKDGMNFYWNRKFVDSLTDTEALFLLIHEDFHLLFDHSKRSISYDKHFSNISQDMLINQIIHDEVMSHEKTKGKITIPVQHDKYFKDAEGNDILDDKGNPILNPGFGKNIGLFIPAEYTGEPIFENLYEWLKDKHYEYKKRKEESSDNNSSGQSSTGKSDDKKSGKKHSGSGRGNSDGIGQGQGQNGQQEDQGQNDGQDENQNNDKNQDQNNNSDNDGNGQNDSQNDLSSDKDSFGKPRYGKYGKNGVECNSLDSIFDSMEKGDQLTLDQHISDDIPENARKSIVNDFLQRLKNRGLVTSDVESVLGKLIKSKYDYLKEIKRTISNFIFGNKKKKSITRPNRRGIEGIKGKKKYKNVINCILDTSGSMGGDFELVLSYIFQNDIHINLIQIDTEIKLVEQIKSKKELQNVAIKGLGGTVLQPAIDFIDNPVNNLFKYNTVILTDGFTDKLGFEKTTGKVLILTTSKVPEYTDPKGIVKYVVIDKKNSINEK